MTELIYLPPTLRRSAFARYVSHRTTRHVLSWLLAVGLASGYLYWAWHFFDEPRRGDGNKGHTFIDFGGQWLLGRMLVEGRGRELYHRPRQRDILQRSYPREDEIPPERRKVEELRQNDVEDLMDSFTGDDDAVALGSLVLPLGGSSALDRLVCVARAESIWEPERLQTALRARGGPLYPPVHALFFAPLSTWPPRTAYRMMQIVNILFAFLAGLGVRQLLPGKVWASVATAAVLIFPGFQGSVSLGQNATITLAILVWGWVLVARGYAGWGGVVWGLLAYKPVWGAAFFLVPLLTARWRMCCTMVFTGAALAVATLPFVGLAGWFDWLHVGRMANEVYATDLHWIFLGRDLLSIPRRWLQDFSDPHAIRDRLSAALLGWGLLGSVFLGTAWVCAKRRASCRAVTGPGAAFLFLGAWMCNPHFMYYDVMLTALPIALLFADPISYLRPRALVTLPLDGAQGTQHPRALALVNSAVLTCLALLLAVEYVTPHLGLEVFVWVQPLARFHESLPQPLEFTTNLMGTPWNTFLLLGLWVWCGWKTLSESAA